MTEQAPHLTHIYYYPIKSCAALTAKTAAVTPLGLESDRMMMITDHAGQFLSQRSHPKMGLISVILTAQKVTLTAPEMASVSFSQKDFTQSSNTDVRIWNDRCNAMVAPESINQWLTDFIGEPVQLVGYDRNHPRPCDPQYAKASDAVSFADGFPLLLTNQASLAMLNQKLKAPVTMPVFRPNVVVSKLPAFAEDQWQQIQIGAVLFDAVKPCSRCVMTTIDPATQQKRSDGEPLKTLSTFRRQKEGVMFGINLIPRNAGSINIGDQLQIIR